MNSNALSLVGDGIIYFLSLISFCIIIRSLLSWFVSPYSGVMRLFVTLTEPFLAPVRNLLARFMKGNAMGMDFSPIVTWLILYILQALVRAIFH